MPPEPDRAPRRQDADRRGRDRGRAGRPAATTSCCRSCASPRPACSSCSPSCSSWRSPSGSRDHRVPEVALRRHAGGDHRGLGAAHRAGAPAPASCSPRAQAAAGRGADLMARGGLVMLLLAINGAVLLVLDVVLDGRVALRAVRARRAWFVLRLVHRPADARERADALRLSARRGAYDRSVRGYRLRHAQQHHPTHLARPRAHAPAGAARLHARPEPAAVARRAGPSLAAHRVAEDRTLHSGRHRAGRLATTDRHRALAGSNADIDGLAEELCASPLPSTVLAEPRDRCES